MKKIFIAIPKISKFRTVIHQGEFLHLSALFLKNGYFVRFYDENREYSGTPLRKIVTDEKPDILIAVLNKADILKREQSKYIISELIEIKRTVSLIIGIGYIAEACKEYYVKHLKVIDIVVSQISFYSISEDLNANAFKQEIQIVQSFYNNFYSIDKEAMDKLRYNLSKDDVISINSSFGCRNSCSFCAYNLHTPNRILRSVDNLTDEIEFYERVYRINRFILSDNSFCNNKNTIIERLSGIIKNRRAKKSNTTFTLNIPASALSIGAVSILKEIGCSNLLIGIETFNTETQIKFNKSINIETIFDIVTMCERNHINCRLSYIMFHPWQTVMSLKHELELIEEIGWYKIPQFFSNSILNVIPNTPIAEYLEKKKSIYRKSDTEWSFKFNDYKVDLLYAKLKKYYDDNIEKTEYISSKLIHFKEDEWNYLKYLVDL
jgi:radical SAM superfamily enzyme YgiQ (UPF0313 family)